MLRRPAAWCCAFFFLAALAVVAVPVATATRPFDVPAGDAAETLKLAARQGGLEIAFFAETARGARTTALRGDFTPHDALARLVAGTGLRVVADDPAGTLTVHRDPPPPAAPPSTASSAPSMKPKNPVATLFAWLTLAVIPALPAQTTPVPSSVTSEKTEAITLSPFTVNAEADTGYAATSTLAGSRFKTDLKDVAASISVLTSDFLSDVGANNLTEALRYSNSAQLDVASAGSDSATPNGNTIQGGPAAFIVRGLPTTQARNYFTLRTQTDNYNVDRIEDSRGPNSVLFGFGSPGGILNVSTKQARLDRTFQKATLQTGSYASHRETLDFNRVLLPGKLALRLNAVYDQANKFQEYAFNRHRAIDLAVKFQVTPTLQLRAGYERSLVKENKPRPWALFDGGIVLWNSRGGRFSWPRVRLKRRASSWSMQPAEVCCSNFLASTPGVSPRRKIRPRPCRP